MQRKMQNLSFLLIVSVMLSCAFFFSQQSTSGKRELPVTATLEREEKSLADLPDCEAEKDGEEKDGCYLSAEAVSRQMVEAKVAEILAQEADPERRMDFMESQFAWEASRDADCKFLINVSAQSGNTPDKNPACIHLQNLRRIETLEALLCHWYDSSACEGSESGGE